jgi:hypothetical protein
MPMFLIEDEITYHRSWIVGATDEEDALQQACNEGPNDSLVEEQTDNQPYSARRIVSRRGELLVLDDGSEVGR